MRRKRKPGKYTIEEYTGLQQGIFFTPNLERLRADILRTNGILPTITLKDPTKFPASRTDWGP